MRKQLPLVVLVVRRAHPRMSSATVVDTTRLILSHPTTIVCREFVDAIHVVCTQRDRPGSLVTASRALIRSRDAPLAQIVARRLNAALEVRHDQRTLFLSLALRDAIDAADDDAAAIAAATPLVAAISDILFNKQPSSN